MRSIYCCVSQDQDRDQDLDQFVEAATDPELANSWNLELFKQYPDMPAGKHGKCTLRQCCGMCTRACGNRCVQDCLNRLYLWRLQPEHSLAVWNILHQRFTTAKELSVAVGEVISTRRNSKLKEYINDTNAENPYLFDYGCAFVLDESGRKRRDPDSGGYLVDPAQGACPYALPCGVLPRSRRERED